MKINKIEIEKNKEGVKEFTAELKNKLEGHFPSLSQPILKNITEVVTAILLVLRTPRGWYGRLTLSGVARCMKTVGGFKVRYKRLDRFLRNKRFEPEQTISGLLSLTYGGGLKPAASHFDRSKCDKGCASNICQFSLSG
jgi:hypothetical protein